MSVQREQIIDAVRGEAGLCDVLARLGHQPARVGREIKIRCPFHDDQNPSLGWFERDGGWCWHCFSCPAGGDVFSFAAKLWGITDFAALCERLGRDLGIVGVDDRTPAEREANQKRLEEQRRADAEKSRRIADAKRKESIEQARAVWREAADVQAGGGPYHPAAAAYFSGRGIDLETLPGGKLSPYIRYLPRCFRKFRPDDGGGAWKTEHVPAVVCGAVSSSGAIVAVQRIFLDPDGSGRKIGYGFGSDKKLLQKQTLGRYESLPGGAAVRLAPPCASGILALTEGVETGVAVQAALSESGTVWACISAGGLRAFRLPDDAAAWVRSIVVMGDCDASRTGQKAMLECADNLACQVAERGWSIRVACCAPDERVASDLVAAMNRGGSRGGRGGVVVGAGGGGEVVAHG